MIARISFLILALLFSLPAQAVFSDDDVTRQIAALRQRALQAVNTAQPDTLYMQAKADAWLDFAFEEHIERDTSGVAEDALQRAIQLLAWLEARQPEGVAVPETIRGTAILEEDLWSAIGKLRHDPAGFPCAARYLGRAEVQLIRAGHEQPELGIRHAHRYIDEAEQLFKEAEQLAQACQQKNALPPDSPEKRADDHRVQFVKDSDDPAAAIKTDREVQDADFQPGENRHDSHGKVKQRGAHHE